MSRYQRIIELGWNPKTLQQSKVLVVGAGALGNEVIKNLALLGIGHITIVDMDRIENHNLTRTILFHPKDIHRYKAEVAAERVQYINTDVQVQYFTQPIQEAFGLGFYKNIDIVFGCLDNIQARLDLNRYCLQTQTFYIDAGLRLLDGDVKVFAPPYEVCLDCTLNQALRIAAWERFSCLKLRTEQETPTLPTSPTISSIMAGFQVQIAIKHLHGASIPTNHRISVMGNIDELGKSRMSFNPACPTHNLYEALPLNKVELLDQQHDQINLDKLLCLAQERLGQEASIELDFDLLTHFHCPHHHHQKPVYQKRGSLFLDEVLCPHCVQEEKTEIASIMQEHFTNQINGNENPALLNKTLNEIGIPPQHIITAKVLKDNSFHYHYFELASPHK